MGWSDAIAPRSHKGRGEARLASSFRLHRRSHRAHQPSVNQPPPVSTFATVSRYIVPMLKLSRLLLAALSAAMLASLPAAAAGGESGGHGERKTTGSATFVPIEGVSATLYDRGARIGRFQVELGLEIPDDHMRETAYLIEPRLRTACSSALRAYVGDHYAVGTVPDAEQIAAMIQAEVDAAFGQPGAQVVLAMLVIHGPR